MTAVQELKYLFDDILKDRGIVITWDTYIAQEKQQIIDAWWNGHDTRDNSLIHPSEDCNGYYNETYNK